MTQAKAEASADYARGVIENALKKTFAPEFLNRIDDVIIFNSLDRDDIHKIIDIELALLFNRIKTMGYQVVITQAAKDFIADKGWDSQFGARPLKRAIQKYIEDVLAEEVIKSKLTSNDIITLDMDTENKDVTVSIARQEATLSAPDNTN
jgi:ATP-dependent Clp protease ATP-binding subunit ClpC